MKSNVAPICLAVLLSVWSLRASATDSTPTDSAITVSIAVPEQGGQRSIQSHGTDPHFHVVIRNVSAQPQRIWREWCSWGYFALSFQFTDQSGKEWVVKKKPRAWSKNYPDYVTLEPEESLVLDVYFTNATIWDGFPHPAGAVGEPFTMSAVFEVKPDDSSRKYSVWTGRVASKPGKYVFRD